MSGDSQSPGDRPSLKSSLAGYLAARAELFSLEAKEASQVASDKAKQGITGALLLIIGYLCLLAALCGFLGAVVDRALSGGPFIVAGWACVSLVFALCHLALGRIYLKKASKRTGQELFPYTKAELQKDREWMKD